MERRVLQAMTETKDSLYSHVLVKCLDFGLSETARVSACYPIGDIFTYSDSQWIGDLWINDRTLKPFKNAITRWKGGFYKP
jgi:hypothetical protein